MTNPYRFAQTLFCWRPKTAVHMVASLPVGDFQACGVFSSAQRALTELQAGFTRRPAERHAACPIFEHGSQAACRRPDPLR